MRSSTILFYINAWIGIAGVLAHLSVRGLNPIVVVTLGGLAQSAARRLTIGRNGENSSRAERAAVASEAEIDRIRCAIVGDPRDSVVFVLPECCSRPVDQTLTRVRRIGIGIDVNREVSCILYTELVPSRHM